MREKTLGGKFNPKLQSSSLPKTFLDKFHKRFDVMIECYKTQIQQKIEIQLSTKEIPPSNQSKPYLAPKNLALAIPSSNNTNHLIRLLLCPPTLISNHELLNFSHQLL